MYSIYMTLLKLSAQFEEFLFQFQVFNIIQVMLFPIWFDQLTHHLQCSTFSMRVFFIPVLTSAVFYLATHPDVDKKLQEEFKTVLGDKDVNASNIDKLV